MVSSLPSLTFVTGPYLVPRWRMMTLPAFTFCPPKILTPKRFDAESRPNEVEPPAFLCANVVSVDSYVHPRVLGFTSAPMPLLFRKNPCSSLGKLRDCAPNFFELM